MVGYNNQEKSASSALSASKKLIMTHPRFLLWKAPYIQLTTPMLVPMAVRMVMSVWITSFQISRFSMIFWFMIYDFWFSFSGALSFFGRSPQQLVWTQWRICKCQQNNSQAYVPRCFLRQHDIELWRMANGNSHYVDVYRFFAMSNNSSSYRQNDKPVNGTPPNARRGLFLQASLKL